MQEAGIQGPTCIAQKLKTFLIGVKSNDAKGFIAPNSTQKCFNFCELGPRSAT